MARTLSGRLALMMAAMFILGGALVIAVSQRMPQLRQLVELGAELVAAATAFALGAALLVFNLFARRLHGLAEEMEAFRASRFTRPRRIAWARPDGDEIDRLAFAFGELSERIARQIAELERFDSQRRELFANVSHDLRTPLTLMQGYLETLLLRRGELAPDEERSCLEVAARHAERLGHLVADLFELAKLDGQAGRLQAEAFPLTELVQDVAQKFGLHASARDVQIEAQLDADTPSVRGDIGLVERALENLVENALRHTPRGGRVAIEVGCAAGRAQVRIRDTGCGIAQADLPHVFDRYFQAPRVESGAEGASGDGGVAARHAGLGLAITRRIVALHGGAIQVESRVGEGTVFGFDLPLAESGVDPAPASAEQAHAHAWGPDPAGPARTPAEDPATAEARGLREALQASEERYVLAVRGAQDGLWEYDVAARRLLLSPRWMHMFGLDAEGGTMWLEAWGERLHPHDRDEALRALQDHVDGHSDRFEHAHRVRHADGRWRWVLSRGTALRRASGKAYRVVGLDTDITQIKRVESIIEEIAHGTAGRCGETFFQSLVQHFARALAVNCAFITECADRPPTRVRTLAVWQGGTLGRNMEYELAGTPCDPVIREARTVFHPRGLGRHFACEAGQQSYLGLPLFGRDGSVIGHLAFVDPSVMSPDIVNEAIYRIFTARAAVEIELTHALRRLAGPEAAAA